jgi:hypothetical protein
MKKIAVIIPVILVLAAAGYVYWYQGSHKVSTPPTQENKVSTLELGKDPKYKDFSLQGIITSVSGKIITFDTTVIKDGEPTVLTKTATITDGTAIISKSKQAGVTKETKITLKDLSVGQTVTFYTQTYPFDVTSITPYRVEFSK